MKYIVEHEDRQDAEDLEIAEYSISGYRFGVQRHHVVDSDTWHPNYLEPIQTEDTAVVGTMLYRGEPIFTIDLRQLFCLEQEPPSTAPSFYTVVKYEEKLFTILHDGFVDTCTVPLTHFRFFQSLYVLGVRWLRGVIILEEYLIIMLSLEALSNLLVTHRDKQVQRT